MVINFLNSVFEQLTFSYWSKMSFIKDWNLTYVTLSLTFLFCLINPCTGITLLQENFAIYTNRHLIIYMFSLLAVVSELGFHTQYSYIVAYHTHNSKIPEVTLNKLNWRAQKPSPCGNSYPEHGLCQNFSPFRDVNKYCVIFFHRECLLHYRTLYNCVCVVKGYFPTYFLTCSNHYPTEFLWA